MLVQSDLILHDRLESLCFKPLSIRDSTKLTFDIIINNNKVY